MVVVVVVVVFWANYGQGGRLLKVNFIQKHVSKQPFPKRTTARMETRCHHGSEELFMFLISLTLL
jgi:hypothetical protein